MSVGVWSSVWSMARHRCTDARPAVTAASRSAAAAFLPRSRRAVRGGGGAFFAAAIPLGASATSRAARSRHDTPRRLRCAAHRRAVVFLGAADRAARAGPDPPPSPPPSPLLHHHVSGRSGRPWRRRRETLRPAPAAGRQSAPGVHHAGSSACDEERGRSAGALPTARPGQAHEPHHRLHGRLPAQGECYRPPPVCPAPARRSQLTGAGAASIDDMPLFLPSVAAGVEPGDSQGWLPHP